MIVFMSRTDLDTLLANTPDELRKFVALVSSDDTSLQPAPLEVARPTTPPPPPPTTATPPPAPARFAVGQPSLSIGMNTGTIMELRRQNLIDTLRSNRWHATDAAAALGVDRATVWKWLKQMEREGTLPPDFPGFRGSRNKISDPPPGKPKPIAEDPDE
jgi:hypothetical protein